MRVGNELPMLIGVTGAGGFVGRALVEALSAHGHRVVALSRRPESLSASPSVERRRFDPNAEAPQSSAFEGLDAVVHLAGESVSGRWTPRKKDAISTSRVAGTTRLVDSIAACAKKPSVLIAASAVGYYGSRGDEPLFESSGPGDDFLARVCAEWESATRRAEAFGLRTASLRTGIVLGAGGALTAMLPPFRFGVGGPFGSGRQFVPWIHIDDLVAMYRFALEGDIAGPINAVAPDYATSARFAQALGAALKRPALLPAPGFALRQILGEFATSILASQLVLPARAEDAGFTWTFPHLEPALANVLRPGARGDFGVRTFAARHVVARARDDVFAFFSDARNLEAMTPPSLRFRIRELPSKMERGARISYRLSVHGIPMNWETLIARWDPPHGFVDVQMHGPYALWRHEHTFEETEGGTAVIDRVEYSLPFAPFGDVARPAVQADIEKIFGFRREVLDGRLAGGAPAGS